MGSCGDSDLPHCRLRVAGYRNAVVAAVRQNRANGIFRHCHGLLLTISLGYHLWQRWHADREAALRLRLQHHREVELVGHDWPPYRAPAYHIVGQASPADLSG